MNAPRTAPAPGPPRRKKALGQHHLRSGELVRPLLDFLAPAGRLVIEVGPGAGVLTRELLAAGARVLAVELDLDWAAEIGHRLPRRRELAVVASDALEFPWERLPAGALVAGNLPYQVGTAIVERVLAAGAGVERAGFLLQREVVERLAASPGEAAYGALSVLVQARATVRALGRVRAGSFVPPPRVESAFVGLIRKEGSVPPHAWGAFELWIRQAFGMRRKTLVNCLASRFPRDRVEAGLAALGHAAGARAEELGLEELVTLARRLGALADGRAGRVEVGPGDTIPPSIGDPRP